MTKEWTLAAMAAACTALAVGGSQNAHALEGGVSPFPVGSTGEFIAALPPIPGVFAVEQFNYSSSNGLYDNGGNKLPVPFKLSAYSATTRVLASYGTQWLGANLYSQLVVPAVSLHTEIAGDSETHRGLSNITLTPIMMRWGFSQYANLTGGLDISLPTGSYSPTRPSVAVGYTSWQPVVAYRYNDPSGLDVGLSNRFMFNQKNGDTGYRSGNAYAGEFTAGWHFGSWKVGVVGGYLNQFSDDSQNGASINANRARSFAIGPSVVYNAGPVNISVNYQQGVYAANMAKSNALWVNFALPLWVKPGL
ncbi:MAG: transporter [Curvibacter sp.]|nr:transporter [Curvibacter sp.]